MIPGFVMIAVVRCVEDQVMGGGGLIWVLSPDLWTDLVRCMMSLHYRVVWMSVGDRV